MPAVDGGYSNLVQGVSQQERRDRRDGQCTAQVNMSSDVIDGLKRRLPTDMVSELFAPEVPSGIELLTNPDFSTADDWTAYTGWTIEDGVAKLSHASPGNLEQPVVLGTVGTKYRVRYSISHYVSGSVRVSVYGSDGSKSVGVARDAFGRYEDVLELETPLTGTSSIIEIAAVSSDCDLWIDDVSVQEIVAGDFQFHAINVAAETFLMATALNSVRVFDLSGVERTVNIQSLEAKDYLSSNMSTTVIDDAVYLASAERVVRMTDEVVSNTPYAIVQVLGGQYARNFQVELGNPDDAANDIIAVYGTPDGSSTTHAGLISSDYIASELYTNMVNNATFNTHYIVTRKHDVLLIGWADADKTDRIEVTTSDGEAGTLLVAASDRTDIVGNLPKLAPYNHVIEVTGLETNDEDAAYYRFDQEVPGFGNDGLWVETLGPGIPYKWDLKTMPHVMDYDKETGEFTLDQGEWEDRQVGDLITNPDRSFIAKPILDLLEMQGRLVMVSTDGAIMSRTNKPLDLFKTSSTTNSDSDPIDVTSSSGSGRSLLFGQMHNRDLVIFADEAQFIIFGRNALTPSNTSMVFTTGFSVSGKCKPEVSGKNVLFAYKKGNYTGIKEFYTDGSADINDSRPITAHVPKYIAGDAVQIAASSNADVVFVRTEDRKVLYMYEYLWDDNGVEKVQSSWSQVTTTFDTKFTFFSENELFLVSCVNGVYYLSSGNLDVTDDVGVGYTVFLDMKTTHTGTTLNTVYPSEVIDDVIVVQGEGCEYPGLQADVIDRTGSVITVTDAGGTLILGLPYTSSYKPTMPMRKDRKGIKISTGELIVDEFLLSFDKTGEIHTRVISEYYDPIEDSYEGFIADTPTAILGTQPINSGTFNIGFGDDADLAELEIYTDNHLPMTLIDLEYTAQWDKEGRRIT